jgi:hypothetical protein
MHAIGMTGYVCLVPLSTAWRYVMPESVRTRVLKNGNNGWYWEVITDRREVLERGVNSRLDAAAAQADRAAQLAAKQLQKQTPFA